MFEKPSIGLLGGGPLPPPPRTSPGGGKETAHYNNVSENGKDPPRPPSMMTLTEMDRWRKEFEEHFQSQVEQIRRVEGKCDKLLEKVPILEGDGRRKEEAVEETVLKLEQELEEEREGRRETVQKLEETVQQLKVTIEKLTQNVNGWREKVEGIEKWREEREERRRSRLKKRPRAKLAESHHHDPHPRQVPVQPGPSSSGGDGGGLGQQVPPDEELPVMVKVEASDEDVDFEDMNYDMSLPVETETFATPLPSTSTQLGSLAADPLTGFLFEANSNQPETPPSASTSSTSPIPVKRGRGRPRGSGMNRVLEEAKRFSMMNSKRVKKRIERERESIKTGPSNLGHEPSGIHGRTPMAGKFLPFLCYCGMEFDSEDWLMEHVAAEDKQKAKRSRQRSSNKGRGPLKEKPAPLQIKIKRRTATGPVVRKVLNGDKKTSVQHAQRTKFQAQKSEEVIRRRRNWHGRLLPNPVKKPKSVAVVGIKRPRGRPRKADINRDPDSQDPDWFDSSLSKPEELKATTSKYRRISAPSTIPMKRRRTESGSFLEPSPAATLRITHQELDSVIVKEEDFDVERDSVLAETTITPSKVGRPRKITQSTLNESRDAVQERMPAENKNFKGELGDVDFMETSAETSPLLSGFGNIPRASDSDGLRSAPQSAVWPFPGKVKSGRPRGRPPKRKITPAVADYSSPAVSSEERSRNPFAKTVASFPTNEIKSKRTS